MTTTTPTTPLTDAELEAPSRVAGWRSMADAAAEIRALRAQRDELLAALKDTNATLRTMERVFEEKGFGAVAKTVRTQFAGLRAAIARAEGRGE